MVEKAITREILYLQKALYLANKPLMKTKA